MTRLEQSEKRALALLNSHFKAWPRLTRTYKMTLRKRVTAAKRPVTAAKGILRDLISVHGAAVAEAAPVEERPDFSAAQEARVVMIRRQPASLQSRADYEDALGDLERDLARGHVEQATFDRRCQALGIKDFPTWVGTYKTWPAPAAVTPLEPVPQGALHRALEIVTASDDSDVAPLPTFLDRRCQALAVKSFSDWVSRRAA